MTIYRNGTAQAKPDPAAVQALRDHEWNGLTAGCSCGWSQRKLTGRRGARLNHAHHVATAIAASGTADCG